MPEMETPHDFKRNILFFFVITSLLFGGLAWNGYCYLGIKGFHKNVSASGFREIMGRNRILYAGPDNGRFFSGFFQKQLEEATSDHLPFSLIFFYKRLGRWLNGSLLNVLPDSWTPFLPIGGDYLFDKEKNRLLEIPTLFSQQKQKLLQLKAEYYNQIVKENPSLRLVVVPILKKADWTMKTGTFLKINTSLFGRDHFVREFCSLLDIQIDCFWPGDDLSPEQALAYYYKTDHHLTMKGGYAAYRRLMSKLFPGDMADPQYGIPKSWFKVQGIKFRGSHARRAGKFDALYDVIEDADFVLPVFQLVINGGSSERGDKTNSKGEYRNLLNNSVLSGKFVNHYEKYFGKDFGLLEYINFDIGDRNVLVIGDSYDNSITELISSNYNHSFFVDLRQFEREMGQVFNVNNFLRINKIDDLIFYGSQNRLLGFSPWKSN